MVSCSETLVPLCKWKCHSKWVNRLKNMAGNLFQTLFLWARNTKRVTRVRRFGRGEVTQGNKSDHNAWEHFKDMSDMHNAGLIMAHGGADLFKTRLCERDCAALCIFIHGIKMAWGGALIPQVLSRAGRMVLGERCACAKPPIWNTWFRGKRLM